MKKELEETKNQAAQDLTAKSEQVIHLTTEHMKEKERLEAIVHREPDKQKMYILETKLNELIQERQKYFKMNYELQEDSKLKEEELKKAKTEVKKLERKLLSSKASTKPTDAAVPPGL